MKKIKGYNIIKLKNNIDGYKYLITNTDGDEEWYTDSLEKAIEWCNS